MHYSTSTTSSSAGKVEQKSHRNPIPSAPPAEGEMSESDTGFEICPISHEVMTDPVMTVGGKTYDRASIERWFQSHNTDPLTGEVLNSKVLVRNLALKDAIDEYNKNQIVLITATHEKQAADAARALEKIALTREIEALRKSTAQAQALLRRRVERNGVAGSNPDDKAKTLVKTSPRMPTLMILQELDQTAHEQQLTIASLIIIAHQLQQQLKRVLKEKHPAATRAGLQAQKAAELHRYAQKGVEIEETYKRNQLVLTAQIEHDMFDSLHKVKEIQNTAHAGFIAEAKLIATPIALASVSDSPVEEKHKAKRTILFVDKSEEQKAAEAAHDALQAAEKKEKEALKKRQQLLQDSQGETNKTVVKLEQGSAAMDDMFMQLLAMQQAHEKLKLFQANQMAKFDVVKKTGVEENEANHKEIMARLEVQLKENQVVREKIIPHSKHISVLVRAVEKLQAEHLATLRERDQLLAEYKAQTEEQRAKAALRLQTKKEKSDQALARIQDRHRYAGLFKASETFQQRFDKWHTCMLDKKGHDLQELETMAVILASQEESSKLNDKLNSLRVRCLESGKTAELCVLDQHFGERLANKDFEILKLIVRKDFTIPLNSVQFVRKDFTIPLNSVQCVLELFVKRHGSEKLSIKFGKYSDTLLHWAAFNGKVSIVRALVHVGAKVDIRNNYQGGKLADEDFDDKVSAVDREAIREIIKRGPQIEASAPRAS